MVMPAAVGRVTPPEITRETAGFWAGLRRGELVVERCRACGRYGFPPRGLCRSCWATDMEPAVLSGPGVIYTFTVNYQAWSADLEVPYVVAIVEFPEYGVRIPGRVRGCLLEAIEIGMVVELRPEESSEGVFVPSFVPIGVES